MDSDLRLQVIDFGTMKYSLDSNGKGQDRVMSSIAPHEPTSLALC